MHSKILYLKAEYLDSSFQRLSPSLVGSISFLIKSNLISFTILNTDLRPLTHTFGVECNEDREYYKLYQ